MYITLIIFFQRIEKNQPKPKTKRKWWKKYGVFMLLECWLIDDRENEVLMIFFYVFYEVVSFVMGFFLFLINCIDFSVFFNKKS